MPDLAATPDEVALRRDRDRTRRCLRRLYRAVLALAPGEIAEHPETRAEMELINALCSAENVLGIAEGQTRVRL